MPAYPANLPSPTLGGFALAPVDPIVRTEMETGASRSRRRTRARNDVVDVSFVYTDAEFTAFRTWFDDETTGIAGGASWFDLTLPIGNGGTTPEVAKFKAIWKAIPVDQYWRVTAQLEIR